MLSKDKIDSNLVYPLSLFARHMKGLLNIMAKQMPKRSLEKVGLSVTGACVALVTLVVVALIFMVAQRGLSTFYKDGVNIVEFFTGTTWNLANTNEATGLPFTGALPLIVTSFAVTVIGGISFSMVALLAYLPVFLLACGNRETEQARLGMPGRRTELMDTLKSSSCRK